MLSYFDVRHLVRTDLVNFNKFRTFLLGPQISNFAPKGLMEIPRPLLYINMTPTKTLIPSDTPNLAFLPGADLLG